MEELKEVVSYSSSPSSSSTSFPAELFGLKLTTPSSSPENVFSSIFPPPSKLENNGEDDSGSASRGDWWQGQTIVAG
ncbi:hypothetical protein CRG98_036181 [Punica granatum]|uniref:Uncharacterized protein n=1 Tax=Punica granatum TaxID=22663 RepID=A0A2I0IHG3_PUNGR|nr:hypothetical protein CRG98_036181 [Punica granatum]